MEKDDWGDAALLISIFILGILIGVIITFSIMSNTKLGG